MNQNESNIDNHRNVKSNTELEPVDSIQAESSQIQTDVTLLPVNKLPELPIITTTTVNNQSLNDQVSTIIFNHTDNSTMLQPNENIPPQQLDSNDSYAIFSELSQLCHNKDGMVWKEIARWVKYEENVEENGTRWSKPYVSTVNVAAFNELRDSFRNGIIIFDSNCYSLDSLAEEFSQLLKSKNLITLEESNKIFNVLMLQKLHLFQTKRTLMRSLADMRQSSSNNFLKLLSGSTTKINCSTVNESPIKFPQRKGSLPQSEEVSDHPDKSKHGSASNLQSVSHKDSHRLDIDSLKDHKFNDAFMRKLPDNVVSNNILVGEVDFLQMPISGFIRLKNATLLGNMTEVSIPTKFIYIYLGPKVNINCTINYIQIGRALATLMSDTIFRRVAFKTQNISALIQAMDDFLNESPILPPNLWDPSTRIEPPEKTPKVPGTTGNRNGGRQLPNQTLLLNKDSSQNVSQHTMSSSEGETTDNTITSQSYYNKTFYLDTGDRVQFRIGNGTVNGACVKDFDAYTCYIDDKMNMDSDDEEELERKQNGLVRSGRWFGGLINDVKRKLPHYKSDFTDALSMQTVASIVFLYFACLTPIITFGGLLGDATGNNIATMESLVCGCLCGIVYGLFAGQPLTILGSTGPVLVFETIVFDFCQTYGYHYLSLRFWIGIWTATILMIFVAFDLSYFVCYITRFTEENFASLISVIFVYKAIEKLFQINEDYPIRLHPDSPLDDNCFCVTNQTNDVLFSFQINQTIANAKSKCYASGGTLVGTGCQKPKYVPDVFLFSFILLTFTYIISIKLKGFIKTRYFTSNIRQLISDFAVPIAIILMTLIDNLTGLPTPKLHVPDTFKPTSPQRTWLVSPFENPMWIVFAAIFPAMLAMILIFMDQQITAVIVNRKENKLKKGCGYHLDLFILSILIVICSAFGLPWFVAATVLSITHVNSLQMVSQTAAPGDRPNFLGIREQRVTQIGIFGLCGLSIFFTPVLQCIPMAVLYGVFLYMGISSLSGSQFIERIAIMFMPQKYQPDYMFLRQVKMYRVHIFTTIQVICFIFLWVVKSTKPISITFPLMLVVMLGIRKILDYFFSQEELKILDDKMPESKRKKKEHTKARMSVLKANLEKHPSNGNIKKAF